MSRKSFASYYDTDWFEFAAGINWEVYKKKCKFQEFSTQSNKPIAISNDFRRVSIIFNKFQEFSTIPRTTLSRRLMERRLIHRKLLFCPRRAACPAERPFSGPNVAHSSPCMACIRCNSIRYSSNIDEWGSLCRPLVTGC